MRQAAPAYRLRKEDRAHSPVDDAAKRDRRRRGKIVLAVEVTAVVEINRSGRLTAVLSANNHGALRPFFSYTRRAIVLDSSHRHWLPALGFSI
jgi:hypothetical protein